jgi:hypothetical protein
MNNTIIIIIVVLNVIAMLFLFVYFSEKVRFKRLFKKTPLQKIAYFKEADVAKIVGNVLVIDTPLKAPLTDRECAYYQIIVEQLVSTGKHAYWKTLVDEEKMTQFLIDDNSGGYAYFDSINLKKMIVKDYVYKTNFRNKPDAKLIEFLTNHSIDSKNWLGLDKKIRYKEAILEPGEKFALIAKGVWKKTEELGLPSSYYRVLYLTPSDTQNMFISDDPTITNEKQQDLIS